MISRFSSISLSKYKKLLSCFLFTAVFTNKSYASFLENNLRYSTSDKDATGLELSQIELLNKKVLDYFNHNYKKDGKNLIIDLLWDSEQVRAFATRDDQNNPQIVIHGGMSKHPLMTEDSYLLILCHELGHFLGGAPKKYRGEGVPLSWSSVEGQADYFATTSCSRDIFLDENKNFKEIAIPNFLDPAEIKTAELLCLDGVCLRGAIASLSLAQVYAHIRKDSVKPSLANKDASTVGSTLDSHPQTQCRLDTMIAGLLGQLRPKCWFSGKE